MIRRLFVAAAPLALAACAVGPNYQPPKLAPGTTKAFAESNASAMLSSQPLAPNWWQLFQDPVLDRLVGEAFAYNTDIRQAEANLRQARGVLLEQRAGLLPTTSISGSYTHGRIGTGQISSFGAGTGAGTGTGVGTGTGTGTGTGIGVGTGTGGVGTGTSGVGTGSTLGGLTSPVTYDLFRAGFDASYEVDIFGRVRRSIEAARGEEQAAKAALDAARISVAAQVAQSYADACGYAAQADVARETARLQTNTLSLTQRLLDAGRGTRRDVDQARVTVEQALAQVPQLEAERRAQLYAIAALTGRPASEIDGEASVCRQVPVIRTVIPVGDGSALLARRPDVRQAERTLAADTARIGIATSALFPRVSLTGSVNTSGQHFSDLGHSNALGFSFGPLISWSFPNIAVATAQIKQARAGADASLAAFQGTVLTALRETEQALARYAAALDRNAALRRAAAAADDAANQSQLRFRSGRDNFLTVLVAEQDRASARAALAQSDTTVADNAVSLFKALGGGWENAPDSAYAAPGAQPQGRHAALGVAPQRN
ncbi:efflux transporter outer membrane subunit [Sphingomonas morindae]|uniref:TolC family protein n=1 Tax=Sphingomonas morindae TaxID=1541170 RepID=A0ABY4X688_9SPHN|nr:TolC family protein [Sphingomonas morindae]USI72409.1 TolC family protein [Sphingomonas morindae]